MTEEGSMFKHILVTLDGSSYGERALAYVADLAGPLSARVTLLGVVPAEDSPMHGASESGAQDKQSQLARKYLDRHVSELTSGGVQNVAAEVRAGSPARAIVEAARELTADLILMSTQGLGADEDEQGLGGVASKVLRTAPCPVFMVRIHRPEPPRSLAEERWQDEGGGHVG